MLLLETMSLKMYRLVHILNLTRHSILIFITTFLMGLVPWANTALVILGTVVVVGTGIDKMTKDKGAIATKILAVPILGGFLSFVTKFSPFNYKE